MRAVVIWDFDRVLFDTDKFLVSLTKLFRENGIPDRETRRAVLNFRHTGKTPSLSGFFDSFRRHSLYVAERKLRREVNKLLETGQFRMSNTETCLRTLSNKGAIHVIATFGHPSFQLLKLRRGLGSGFHLHFTDIVSTSLSRPKTQSIEKILRRFPRKQVFFVDDVKKNVEEIEKKFPFVHGIHFRGTSLKMAEKEILRHLR